MHQISPVVFAPYQIHFLIHHYVVYLVQPRTGPIQIVSTVHRMAESPCVIHRLTFFTSSIVDFVTLSTVAGWLNVIGLTLQAFLLISYTVLPAAKAQAHYLTICLTISVVFINVSRLDHIQLFNLLTW